MCWRIEETWSYLYVYSKDKFTEIHSKIVLTATVLGSVWGKWSNDKIILLVQKEIQEVIMIIIISISSN